MNRIQMISLKTRLGIGRDVEVETDSLRARWRSHNEARTRAPTDDSAHDSGASVSPAHRRRS